MKVPAPLLPNPPEQAAKSLLSRWGYWEPMVPKEDELRACYGGFNPHVVIMGWD